ncbi:hypothetical protein RchiOBHm_Chr5g0048291 [Rosa chinensis]|uniref:Uncharacterized protein n=1 Tax=Rosa chinensis TaxID=74649 RepID=A0A2P6QEK8_ROSCH|nr:hypothetical protein RchiOBHm_Chr5g0048291 [Rosa chinensis]
MARRARARQQYQHPKARHVRAYMTLIPYDIAGGRHHLRTAKEKVHIGESLTLFFLAFFLSSVAVLCFFTILLTLLCSLRPSSFVLFSCSTYIVNW